MRKNIDLPDKTIKQLERMAKSQRMKVKPFMEKLLIDTVAIEVIITRAKNAKTLKQREKNFL